MEPFNLNSYLQKLVENTVPDFPEQFGADKIAVNQGNLVADMVLAETREAKMVAITAALSYVAKFEEDIGPLLKYLTQNQLPDDAVIDLQAKRHHLQIFIMEAYHYNRLFHDVMSHLLKRMREQL
jgi:hypothetical protein